METRFRRNVLTAVRLLILLFLTIFVFRGATQISYAKIEDAHRATDLDNALFLPAQSRLSNQDLMPASMRARAVNINLMVLEQRQFRLNLFADTVFTAVFERLEQNQSDSYSWFGTLQNVEHSNVILVVQGQSMFGHITTPTGEYVLEPLRGRQHIIGQIHPNATLSGEDDFRIPEEEGTEADFMVAPTASDDGSLIDVMVVYTDDAVAAHTTSTIEGWIDLFMAYTNQAYANSNVSQRVALVHTAEVSYIEPGDLDTALTDLETTGDGKLDDVHVLRNTYHADLVLLLVNDDGNPSNFCSGLASLQINVNQSFEDDAFGTMKACSFGSSTFAHELGHNMGLRHDWYVDEDVTPFSHAHGFVDTTNEWRTIMAYNNHCTALGKSCSRIQHFSNPSVSYNGATTGVATGTNQTCTEGNTLNPACDADAQLALANTAANTAAFRKSEIRWLGNSTDWNLASNWEMDEGVSPYTTENRVPRSIDNVLIPTTPSGGNFPTISSGTLNARDVTIETGASLTMSGGTLNVYGNWEEQGTGSFAGTGGTVVFKGAVDSKITTNSDVTLLATQRQAAPMMTSTFNNVEIGDGSSKTVTLNNNIDINDTLTVKTNATFTLNGNKADIEGAGTMESSSTVNVDSGTFDLNSALAIGTNASFVMTSGTAIINGNLTVSSGANVDFGSGNADINGDFTLSSGAVAAGGSSTINVSGNWQDDILNGFTADTSNVIFDGATQTVDTVTSVNVLDEDFNSSPSTQCSTGLPTGWSDEHSSFWGMLWCGTNSFLPGVIARWTDTSDGWLFSPSLQLSSAVTYELQYKYQVRFTGTNDFDAYVSSAATSGSMLATPTIHSDTGTTTQQTATVQFTVPSDGTYYIGFRSQGSNYGTYDDVSLSGTGKQIFNNITVAAGATSFSKQVQLNGNLVTNAGATADFGANDPTVEGTVTNNGTLKQTKDVPNGATTQFLEIFDKSASNGKYYGTHITPASTGLGSTSVEISGNQECTTVAADVVLDRCYNITPTNHNTAAIRYYYTDGELNGLDYDNLTLWDWNSGAWVDLAAGNVYGSGCNITDAGCWGTWNSVSTYSPMVLGSATQPAGAPAGTCSAPTLSGEAIARDGSGDNQVSWTATSDAVGIWYKADDPYFPIAGTCAAPGAGLSCLTDADNTSPSDAGALPNSTTSNNYYFLVQAINSCGLNAEGTQRLGDFTFEITPGTP